MSSAKHTHTLSVKASTKHLSEVRNFVATHAKSFGFEDQEISDIRLAVDEAFTNIIEHAYRNDEKQSVKITLGQNGQTFWISLFDSGESFSLTDYKKPDVEKKIKQKKRGGVGVYLIKKLMDDVEYLHEGPQNEIRMIKKR